MKTRRIKIKVLVTEDGFYLAGGGGTEKGDNEVDVDGGPDWLWDGIPERYPSEKVRMVIVEADIPLPETVVVEGEVVKTNTCF